MKMLTRHVQLTHPGIFCFISFSPYLPTLNERLLLLRKPQKSLQKDSSPRHATDSPPTELVARHENHEDDYESPPRAPTVISGSCHGAKVGTDPVEPTGVADSVSSIPSSASQASADTRMLEFRLVPFEAGTNNFMSMFGNATSDAVHISRNMKSTSY